MMMATIEHELDSQCRKILDAMPIMVFVVDEDVRVLDINRAAKSVFGVNKPAVLRRRGGDIFRCLHSCEVPEGCGRAPLCRNCVIRNSVRASLKGRTITRRRMKAESLLEEVTKELELLITTSPMPGNQTALLIIENISEITNLKDLLPICMRCKKIRDDDDYWRSVESYFKEYIGVDFTHGICPDCMHELYPDVQIQGQEAE